jgi:TRAP-type mannitol/chloroaromatic compound transport system permease small subunit
VTLIVKIIDRLTTKIAFLCQLLIFTLTFVTVYSALARYFLRMPDMRAFFLSIWLYGISFIFGCAYNILTKQHTVLDLLYIRLPPHGKRVLDWLGLFSTLLLCIILIPISTSMAWYSYLIEERDFTSIVYAPIIWWYKALVVPVLMLTMLQLISQILKLKTNK